MNPMRIDTSDLIGLPPPSPMNEEKVSSWMAKNSGGPELQRDLGQQGGEEGDQHDREEGPDERGAERGGERLTAVPLAGHRIAVEGGRHRPRLARDVEQDRRDRSAEERAPVEAGEQDDRGGGIHGERQREQDRDPVGAAQARQHADDGAERDAEHREPEVGGLQRHREAEEQVLPAHRSVAEPGLERAPWASAPGTTSRTRGT
jgi:hypothetical protein